MAPDATVVFADGSMTTGTGGATTGAPFAPRDAATHAPNADAALDASEADDAAEDAAVADATVDPSCEVGVWDGGEPELLALTGHTFAHDPTLIEEDGIYYRFWTGDHVQSARSNDLRHWTAAPTVYGGDYPAWVDDWLGGVPGHTFNFPWAPDVLRFAGEVHLYASFSARFGDNVSCITHLSTESLAEPDWTDHGPVICSRGDEPYNAIDADVGFDGTGRPWLAFGSFWDGIFAIPLTEGGNAGEGGATRLAWAPQIEAPVLLSRCGWHYLLVTWGLCCPGPGRSVDDLTYRVAVGRSRSLLGPYVDREGRPMLEGGGTLVVQGDGSQFAAAGHSDVLVVGENVYHAYHAYRAGTGRAELRIARLYFDDEGWPVPHAP